MAWNLSGLPTTTIDQSSGASLAIVTSPESAVPIARFTANRLSESLQSDLGLSPVTVQLPYVAPSPGGLVQLQTTLETVSLVTQNGVAYTPALSSPPAPGEFVLLDGEVTIHLKDGATEPGLGFVLEGAALTQIPTNYVTPTLFQMFWNIPIVGQIAWDLSAEAHPSSSLKIICNDELIPEIRNRFRVGRKMSWAEIGFAVTSYKETMKNSDGSPGYLFEVEISLGGWWESPEHQELSLLLGKPSGLAQAGGVAKPAQCTPSGGGAAAVGRSRLTTVVALAAQVGVPFTANTAPLLSNVAIENITTPSPMPGPFTTFLAKSDETLRSVQQIGAWSVPIPPDATADLTASWDSEMQSRLRVNGCFADYSSPRGVVARDLWSVPTWHYKVLTVATTVQGDTRYSNSHLGYAAQLKAARLTGAFGDAKETGGEDSQGSPEQPTIPRWIPKPKTIYDVPSGNEDLERPPFNVRTTCTMSLNSDESGPTKERIVSTMQGGVEIRRERQVYGFTYTSLNITDNSGRCSFPALSFYWKLVESEVTETQIDDNTGYVLGTRTIGRKRGRYKVETDEFELRNLPPGDPTQMLYQHRWIPSLKREGKLLRPYGSYYRDASREIPPYEVVEICQPDGSLKPVVVKDPNYTPPLFEAATRSYSNTFTWAPHPDDPDDTGKLVMTGQEIDAQQNIQILPSATTIQSDGGAVPGRRSYQDSNREEDQYVSHNVQFSAEGPNLRNVAEERKYGLSFGRPSGGQRLADRYERVEPEKKGGDAELQTARPDPDVVEHILCTPGYTPDSPSTDSVAFEQAQTLSEAMMGVRTQLKIEDVQSSVNFELELPDFNLTIRPFDRLVVQTGFELLPMRVKGCSWQVDVEGSLDGAPFLTRQGGVAVTAGIDREIPITYTKRVNPARNPAATPDQPNPPGSLFFITNFVSLDNLFPGQNLQGRGNIPVQEGN